MSLDDRQLLRYSRHILLDDIGVEGQEAVSAAHVLVIGAGGLGSAALMYLASAGVGTLTVVDHDSVDLTNLQRQIVHRQASIGQLKAESARDTLLALNPEITIHSVTERMDAVSIRALVARADLVLDCTDNFTARQAINAACVMHRKPLVSGAAVGWDGQVAVWGQPGQACYACLFPPDASVPALHCATMGVFAPLVGIIGAMQAAEALKTLIHAPKLSTLGGRLLMLDGRAMQWREIRVMADPHCPVCHALG